MVLPYFIFRSDKIFEVASEPNACPIDLNIIYYRFLCTCCVACRPPWNLKSLKLQVFRIFQKNSQLRFNLPEDEFEIFRNKETQNLELEAKCTNVFLMVYVDIKPTILKINIWPQVFIHTYEFN